LGRKRISHVNGGNGIQSWAGMTGRTGLSSDLETPLRVQQSLLHAVSARTGADLTSAADAQLFPTVPGSSRSSLGCSTLFEAMLL